MESSEYVLRPVIKATHLSRPPLRKTPLVTVMALAFVTATSALRWHYPTTWGQWMESTPADVFERHDYWRLVTSFLIHRDVDHWIANAFPFGILVYHLYGYCGARVFPFGTLALGVLITATSLFTYDANVNLLGASGMIYGMAGFWLTLFLFVERNQSIENRAIRALGFALVMLFPSQIKPEVSYRTHAIGLAWGVIWGVLYYLKNRRWLHSREIIELE